MHRDADGVRLLTSEDAGELLRAAADRAGGRLGSWRLEHVDTEPDRATTATFTATVDWPDGPRVELFGASVRVGGPSHSDRRAEIFDDGHQQVAVWIHPDDPDLPALPEAAFPESVARLLTGWGVVGGPLPHGDVHLRMLTKHPSQLARPAPASAPDKERSAHGHHLTSKPGWRQPDFRATGRLRCPQR